MLYANKQFLPSFPPRFGTKTNKPRRELAAGQELVKRSAQFEEYCQKYCMFKLLDGEDMEKELIALRNWWNITDDKEKIILAALIATADRYSINPAADELLGCIQQATPQIVGAATLSVVRLCLSILRHRIPENCPGYEDLGCFNHQDASKVMKQVALRCGGWPAKYWAEMMSGQKVDCAQHHAFALKVGLFRRFPRDLAQRQTNRGGNWWVRELRARRHVPRN